MNDDQLLRYSRQIMLPDFGIEAQQALLDARVLIIGLGGLGSPVAMYLAAAGVGHLVLCDDDVVDLSNLQRQIVHDTSRLGQSKVESARHYLLELNPEITVTTINHRLGTEELHQQTTLADVIVDASDNFTTRYLLNETSVETRTPLVSGAAIQLDGQVTVFRPDLNDQPCYRCLYRDGSETEQTCSENGILAPIVGIIGSVQALETIKVLTGIGDDLSGRLMILDGRAMEWRTLKLKRDPACPVCANHQSHMVNT